MTRSIRSAMRGLMLLALIAAVPLVSRAQTQWFANVGAETPDESIQANAFLPNEIWIHAGDNITWTFVPVNEIHTVTFLTPDQVRPSAGSCVEPSGTSFDGTSCVSSLPSSNGTKYTVTFPMAGNYKLVCLIHINMNGTIHVLPASTATLPYTQSSYNSEAASQATDLLLDGNVAISQAHIFGPGPNGVVMHGEMTATPGGRLYAAVVRFLPYYILIHAGDTVEWMNTDPTEPHTVTFGPADFAPTSVTTNDDGSLQGTISSTSSTLSSGILQAAPEDAVGRAQSPPGTTRILVTFPNAGTYQYICSIHVADGMKGWVEVIP